MLQQILKEMWVDPEILAELDEGQKQTLFCKMREEQVRRWRVWDEKLNNQELQLIQKQQTNKKPRKNVSFLMGDDNEPWTWVMGEHPDDKKIEEILEEEARELARKQAEKEAEELRKTVEKQLTDFIDLPKIDDFHNTTPVVPTYIDDSMDIYCSVDELREKIQNNKISNNKPLKNTLNNFTFHTMNNNTINNNRSSSNVIKYNTINNFVSSNDKRDALQEISLNKPVKVAQKVALWEKRLMEERTSEIFKRIQKKQLEAAKEAEEFERIQEQLWKEQERKAKEAEQQIREIARRAREEHRRTTNQDLLSTNSTTPSSTPSAASPTVTSSTTTNNSNGDSEAYSDVTPFPGARPPSKQAVVEWYRASEVPRRAGIDDKDQPSPWFHGLIDRHEAETLLHDQPEGTFLIRVSERIWGYAISYRASDRCKHYLVDASSGHYQFLGANQISHDTLGDLINYHGLNPITVLGNEKLLHSCPKTSEPAILNGIIGPCR